MVEERHQFLDHFMFLDKVCHAAGSGLTSIYGPTNTWSSQNSCGTSVDRSRYFSVPHGTVVEKALLSWDLGERGSSANVEA